MVHTPLRPPGPRTPRPAQGAPGSAGALPFIWALNANYSPSDTHVHDPGRPGFVSRVLKAATDMPGHPAHKGASVTGDGAPKATMCTANKVDIVAARVAWWGTKRHRLPRGLC